MQASSQRRRAGIRLFAFPSDSHDLLDQYAAAFEKVLTDSEEIAAAIANEAP